MALIPLKHLLAEINRPIVPAPLVGQSLIQAEEAHMDGMRIDLDSGTFRSFPTK